jgi:hypothetical protein
MIPIIRPINEERRRFGAASMKSFSGGIILPLMGGRITFSPRRTASIFSAWIKTWDIEKSPISAGIRPIPDSRYMIL